MVIQTAVKKFGHSPGMKKMKLEKMESRNSCSVKVGGVGVEGMATLSKVGALVRDWRIG